jgi:hypothetical protein
MVVYDNYQKTRMILSESWELSTMPWTMSAVEAAIFVTIVLTLAGAGAWASAG